MNFRKEMIEKAKAAASPEELTAMAKAEGISLTETEAAEYFNLLHGGMQALSDEELNAVAGGKGGSSDPDYPDPKYKVGQHVFIIDMNHHAIISYIGNYVAEKGYYYYLTDFDSGESIWCPALLETMNVTVVN